MKYRRVLLVNPPYPGSLFGAIRPPASLGYLAETLKKEGIAYDVLDMTLGYGFCDLRKKIEIFKPDLLGIGMMTYMYKHTYRLLSGIKGIFKDLAIAVGGAHVAAFGQKVLEECLAIDYAIFREGELTLVELCQKDEPGNIKGLFYRRGQEVLYTQDRNFIDDLDQVPFPTYDKFQLDRYITKELDMITTRGCPYQCIYCTVHLSCGRKIRFRSPQNVVEELVYWHRRGYRRFQIADDNFSIDKKRLLEICRLIEKGILKNLIFRCGNGVRADKIDEELLQAMRRVGFKHIAIGIEGGNNKVLKAIKKGEDIGVIRKSVEIACRLKFDVTLFFLVGSPSETWADFMDSVRLAREYPVMSVNFFNLIPYPGTELYNWVTENAHLNYPSEVYLNKKIKSRFFRKPLFYTAEFTNRERMEALRLGKKTEGMITRNTILRKFEKWGAFGKVVAWICSIESVRNLFRINRFFRKLVESTFETW